MPAEAAAGWATPALAAVEGALVLCRAKHTTEPLRRTGELLAAELDAAAGC